MDIHQKIDLLGEAATLDCEGPPKLTRAQQKAQFLDRSRVYVTHPQKGRIPVLRTMQTSACERNCRYCPFQAGRNYRRVSLTSEELAASFDKMQQKKLVDGLFLSSGIIGGGAKSMDKMLDTVDILRRKYAYEGYIHLKIMPGTEAAQIEQAARLANRLSINLEGANAQRLPILAPKKDFQKELMSPIYWLHQNRQNLGQWVKPPSVVTQFVVGPAGESDHELLSTVSTLYQKANLGRAYYSAFNPIADTPFHNQPKTPPVREHRLYQADWLLRFYGFKLKELPFDTAGNLPTATDPKLAWAKANLQERPIELNRATRAELLRIPGIGPKSADVIIAARRQARLTELQQLQQLGVQTTKAAPYVLLHGKRPAYQLTLNSL